jgi:hypothetical protein
MLRLIGMKGVLRIVAVVVATALLLCVFTEYLPGTLDAQTDVLGLPVVSIKQVGAHGWIAIGQAGTGVLVIAQLGAGVVAFVQVGAAAIFGIGQLMFSLLAIGQLGVGLVGYVGQAGVGAQAVGGGVWHRLVSERAKEIGQELDELLHWR